MQQLKSYIALFLLLLFVRAMVPDGLLLGLHAHEHTAHASHHDSNKAEISKEHIHCAVAQLFGAPCQPGSGALEFRLVVHQAAYTATCTGSYEQLFLFSAYLRGPPVV